MPERTQRGEDDRKREDEEVMGEPVANVPMDQTGTQAATITRDKRVEPSRDEQRDGHGEERG